jgi:hypothetical protein
MRIVSSTVTARTYPAAAQVMRPGYTLDGTGTRP